MRKGICRFNIDFKIVYRQHFIIIVVASAVFQAFLLLFLIKLTWPLISKYDYLISETSSVPLNLKYDSNSSSEILAFNFASCKTLPSCTNKLVLLGLTSIYTIMS